jgi:hypothetical protein
MGRLLLMLITYFLYITGIIPPHCRYRGNHSELGTKGGRVFKSDPGAERLGLVVSVWTGGLS